MIVEHIRNITGKITVGGFAVLEGDWWHGENTVIEDSKLFYVTDGEASLIYKGEEHICRKGELVLVPSRQVHSYSLTEKKYMKQFWFHFSLFADSESVFDKYDMPLKVKVKEEEKEKIESLFSQIVGEDSAGNIIYQCGKLGALCDLVFFFMTRADCKKKNTDTTEIDRVLQYISDNISAPLTLQTLASVACLSPNYFVRKFTAALGMPPLKYVFTVRMERAKLLIKKGGRISEIMTDLGFTDAAYFSKAFKSYTGFSPRAYRKTLSLQLQD